MTRYLTVLLASVALVATAGPRRSNEAASGQPPVGSIREQAYRANNVGVAHLEQFDYPGAESSFQQALKLYPDLAIARVNLAIALFYAGKPAEAAAAAREAAARLPDSPQAHYITGLIAKAENHLDEAAAAFERVLKLDPVDAATRVQLGQIHLQQRRYPDALKMFQEAMAAEPYNVTAAYNLALALTRSGRTDEGPRAMQRFESLRDSAYGVTYSQTYLGQGRHAEALASTGAEPELVNPGTPAVTFAETVIAPAAAGDGGRGGLTLVDADGDGDLDLVDAGSAGARFFRNERGRFTDGSARAGLAAVRNSAGVLAGDYDNDSRADLLFILDGLARLFHQRADGTFEDATATAALPALPASASTAAFADVDHDGDLDLVIAGTTTLVVRNNGNGTFTDITAAAGLAAPAGSSPAVAVAPVDFDNRRDVDILVVSPGRAPALYRNLRDGSFRDAAPEVGLSRPGGYTAVAVADVNKDNYPDFFLSTRDAGAAVAFSDGQGRFRIVSAPDGAQGAIAAQFADYDNDGLLDLFALFGSGVRIFRNAGPRGWVEVTTAAGLAATAGQGPTASQAMALGDLDGDGDTDAVVRETSGRLRILSNTGGNRNASLRVRLAGRVSNRSGVGARVELRAGSLRQLLESGSATPAVAPADITFGLGSRQAADVIRVLWPSGILQAETSFGDATTSGDARAPATITELDRKPSSCPYLFTWNGAEFTFVTDFMGGGEMGAWLAPAIWSQPDPDEYVRIDASQLRPRAGRYELRLTNELEEALFFDRLQLLVVDHPAGTEVFPNEGLRSPPRPPFALTATRGARPPARAVDGHGHDVLSRVASLDRQYPDDFRLLPIRGYAEPHELVLDLGDMRGDPVLLMTGWTDYAFSNDNVAASQRGVVMQPPSLQVRDRSGAWRTVIDEIGFPVGRPQTVAVDLAGKFPSSSREIRIVTNMRIYWDRVLVGERTGTAGLRVARLDAASADLRWRGLSAEISPDGREPFGYAYERVTTRMPWKVMTGRYTREGDVKPLIRAVDDLFVVSRPGDEIAVSFEALPPAPAGGARTFLLYVHGYSKEMNPRSAVPDTVEPLPFRAMSGYPYGPDEHYPRTRTHLDYLERYNTRQVRRPWPSIDSAMVPGVK